MCREVALSPVTAVTCLVPARTDTKWWHERVAFSDEVIFLRGRIKFESEGKLLGSALFPFAIMHFSGRVFDGPIMRHLDGKSFR